MTDLEMLMQPALEAAKKCLEDGNDVPVGCAIYKGDELLAVSSNTRQTERNVLGHAEIKAIDEACKKIGDWRLNECTLFVTLEPCAMCSGAIAESRIGTVVYGASRPDGDVHTARCAEILPDTVKIIPDVCARESVELLQSFFEKRRSAKNKVGDVPLTV